ncbi:hypothetical protein [Streptomyces sp. TRM64462]|uniref:hypothetical protein n=1 Tax=Streptomyces sp. TRM64462 TaxID=2741726 RepID=UPI0015860DCE|nr:hypothetical protein [Streptomyces sp. TRM64462]
MTQPRTFDVVSLKAFIERETAALRADVRQATEEAGAAAASVAGEGGAVGAEGEEGAGHRVATQCPCGQGNGALHSCVGAGAAHDPWRCLCATLPAIPASAALLEPVRDESGAITDFLIRAGNHVRSSEWLVPPDEQVGRRYLAARPGAAAGGLLDALTEVLETGRALNGLVVDYTEERFGRLRRVQLVHHAACCGDRVLMTWRPVRSQAELLTIDAQHLASMGWGRWGVSAK